MKAKKKKAVTRHAANPTARLQLKFGQTWIDADLIVSRYQITEEIAGIRRIMVEGYIR